MKEDLRGWPTLSQEQIEWVRNMITQYPQDPIAPTLGAQLAAHVIAALGTDFDIAAFFSGIATAVTAMHIHSLQSFDELFQLPEGFVKRLEGLKEKP